MSKTLSKQYSGDEMEDLNSPADYQWRCPCIGMPCDTVRFGRIQDLVLHMEREHYLSIVIVQSPSGK